MVLHFSRTIIPTRHPELSSESQPFYLLPHEIPKQVRDDVYPEKCHSFNLSNPPYHTPTSNNMAKVSGKLTPLIKSKVRSKKSKSGSKACPDPPAGGEGSKLKKIPAAKVVVSFYLEMKKPRPRLLPLPTSRRIGGRDRLHKEGKHSSRKSLVLSFLVWDVFNDFKMGIGVESDFRNVERSVAGGSFQGYRFFLMLTSPFYNKLHQIKPWKFINI